jgi:DNA-binding IclR family transcriptional regulator
MRTAQADGSGSSVEASGVKSAKRALEILEYLTRVQRTATFSDIAAALRYPRSSLHGLLGTLAEMGWVELDPAKRTYMLGIRAWEAGQAYLRALDLATRARPFMEHVRDELDETVQLTILDGHECVYIARLDGSHRLVTTYTVGGRVEAHPSAGGKALLACLSGEEFRRRYDGRTLERFTPATITTVDQLTAELEEIRRRGYSVDNEEYTVGVRCIALPAFDHNGDAVAAMSVSVPTVRFGPGEEEQALTLLRKATASLSQALGYRGG